MREEFLNVAESPMVQIATIAESMPGSLKLCYGESDLPTPRFIIDALTEAALAGHTFYTHTAGYRELRQAIAAKLFELHQVRYDVPEIMATVGGTMAIYTAIRTFVGRGDNAVIVSPAYAHLLERRDHVRRRTTAGLADASTAIASSSTSIACAPPSTATRGC